MAIQRKPRQTKSKKSKIGKKEAAQFTANVPDSIHGGMEDAAAIPGGGRVSEAYTPDQLAAQRLKANRNKRQRLHSRLVNRSQQRDRGFEISYKQILLAADQGKKWAIVELAAYAEYQRDYLRAIEQYERLALQGDLYYMRRIAVIYEQSLEDLDSAIDWYIEAGHYGDEYSMIRAGNLLELHFEDYDEAIALYRKAAQLNSLGAICQLCRVYQYNLQNYDLAIEWYQRAVQLGDLKAAISLGQLYENSLKDYDKAVEWYSVAANHKSLYAVNLLCQLYETKLRDYPRAIEWYKKAIALYNEQNGPDTVAVDIQAKQSMNAVQMSKANTAPQVQASPPADVSKAFDASDSRSAYMASGQPQPVHASSPANPQDVMHELDDDLLPRPDDLTPAEIASATPGLNDEAEIEFLG